MDITATPTAPLPLTTCSAKMHEKMGPFLPEVYSFPFFGIDQEDEVVERECLRQMETAFASYLPANEVAAIIIEPVQGGRRPAAGPSCFHEKTL